MSRNTGGQRPLFDEGVQRAARKVEQQARRDLFDHAGGEWAVIVRAPAGAGKTQFVAQTVIELFSNDGSPRRVAVVAPTNAQAHNLVERLAKRKPKLPVTFVYAQGRTLPPHIAELPNVSQMTAQDAGEAQVPLVVATIDKLADAHRRGSLADFDALIMDEAFQADSARYFAVGGVAPTHLLVGDPGQLDPFSTLRDASLWRGGPEDPLQTAVDVVRRNHPDMPVHRLPVTRRLDPRAVPVARCFYPGHDFGSAILPDVRKLRLGRPSAGSRQLRPVDEVLDEAARHGWGYLVLPGVPSVRADPVTAELICGLVSRLLERQPRVRCEENRSQALKPCRIAVGVSHTDQKALVRTMLDGAGFPDVAVETANRLQGLEFDVVIAWHPLAGSPATDAFHLDPGRLCVLLTRHRHACIVVGRANDRALLEGIPPATPGYLGYEPDPLLDGWDAHEQVFEHLDAHRVDIGATAV